MNEQEYKSQKEPRSLASEIFILFDLKDECDPVQLNQDAIDDFCMCVRYLVFDNEVLRRENQFLQERLND